VRKRISNRSRGGSSSKKKRSSVLRGIGLGLSQITENAKALDGARNAYESNDDLGTILKAFYGQTGSEGDDRLAGAIVDGLAEVRSVSANLAISFDGIVQALEGIVETIDELMTRPLREIVEDTDE